MASIIGALCVVDIALLRVLLAGSPSHFLIRSELPGKAYFCHLPLHYPSAYIVIPDIIYYLVNRVCSYLCVLNFLDDLDRSY